MDDLYDKLKATIASLKSVVVAYSGGVDSALLLKVCHDVLGERCLGVLARSESIPEADVEEAIRVAALVGADLRVIRTHEMDRPDYRKNPIDRCYHCKTELFDVTEKVAEEEGYDHVVYGETLDDVSDYRPGATAARERKVRSPLREAGLTKEDVRRYSRWHGLPTAERPASPCLASRIPYGEEITVEKLGRIEKAEAYLKSRGFPVMRVRHHDGIARIEVPPDDIPRLLEEREALVKALRAAGFSYVTVDLQGFRSGSLNEGLTEG